MSKRRFTLGRNERLKSRKAIEQLFVEGQRFAVPPLRIFYLLQQRTDAAASVIQCGVGVSSKNFKRAVDRNRIKRLIREAYRLQKNEWQQKMETTSFTANIFIIYTARELPDHAVVMDKVNQALKKMIKLTDEKNSSHT